MARDLAQRLDEHERADFVLPSVVEELVRRGWTGAKSGRGFYQKHEVGEILALDSASFEYRPSHPAAFSFASTPHAVSRMLASASARCFIGRDKVGEFLRTTLAPTLLYAARIAPEVAHSPDDVDRAMRWGFGWELGPFETLRAIGVEHVARAIGGGRKRRGARP